MRRQLLVVLVAAVLAAWLAGCRSPSFTRPRYDTIYIGQPDWDVRKFLGRPTYQEFDTWTYVHSETPYCRAVIHFREGKVVAKDWSYEPPTDRGQGF
jgi:outer membrane protein assembly factor BamE (lipoprotein component of BamABCDE complex)